MTAAASMRSMEGTGMAGSGTPPGRAATAAAVAVTEVAMVPATAAAMAEGMAAAVAAGIERSSKPATGIFFVSLECGVFYFVLSISPHKHQTVDSNCYGNNPSYMILFCSYNLSVFCVGNIIQLSRMPHLSNVVFSCL